MSEFHASSPSQNTKFRSLGLVALGLLLGVALTWLVKPSSKTNAAEPIATPHPTKYQCPMHPQIILDHEGDCPICGMKLVLIGGGEIANEGATVDAHAPITIDAQRQQLIGLTTATVAEGPISGEIRTSGRVSVDETRVRKINVKVEGYVEKLYVDFLGKPVAKGQPLFSLYSPEFVSAQKEYLLALKTQKALSQGSLQASGGELLEAAKRRLQLWDVPGEAIDRLEQTGEVQRTLILRSPISGIVTAKNVIEGARITPADAPFEVTDLSRVWILADVYETELSHVKVGMDAEWTVPSAPGQSFHGRVAFIDPLLDPKTRTAKVRVEIANPKGEWKPDLFGEVRLKGMGREGILVPQDAVVDSGTLKVVFIALGNGRFEPREVTTGANLGEQVEILSGLKAGEEIVTRATFLVDSESRFRAALAGMKGGH